LSRTANEPALRGWRNRATGTMHLSAECPDFERLEARLIEDTLWRPGGRYASLCAWCFPREDKEEEPPPRRRRR